MDHQGYRKLDVWHRAMELAEMVYDITNNLPADEKFGLISQVRRAAVSVPSNIAEDYSREHRGDYLRFIAMSRGSLAELETQLTLTVRMGLVERDQAMPLWDLLQTIGRMLTNLMKALRQKPAV